MIALGRISFQVSTELVLTNELSALETVEQWMVMMNQMTPQMTADSVYKHRHGFLKKQISVALFTSCRQCRVTQIYANHAGREQLAEVLDLLHINFFKLEYKAMSK